MQRLRAPKGGVRFQGRFYKGGQFLPKAYKPAPDPKPKPIDDETLIMIAMDGLPRSTEYAQAMHRYLRDGERTPQRWKSVLDGRRLEAIANLRDNAGSDRDWKRLNGLYIQTARGMA